MDGPEIIDHLSEYLRLAFESHCTSPITDPNICEIIRLH